MQLTPETWDEVAEFTGGLQTIIDGNQAVTVLNNGVLVGTIQLGDWGYQDDADGTIGVIAAEQYTQQVIYGEV